MSLASPAPAHDAHAAPDRGMQRVLILSTDLGGGHDALAAGLRQEILASHPEATVEVENGLRIASPLLNELARDGYKETVERKPWIFQLWYVILSATALARIARWAAWRTLHRSIVARIETFQPDIVVSTYPFLTAVLGKLRREGQLQVPAVGLLIDSSPHDVWLAPGIDLHVALNPTDCERARAVWPPQRYYPPLHITSARPAVDPRCRREYDRASCREQFDLPADASVLLVSGGSWGLALDDGDLHAIVDHTDAFLAIACGRNDELADRLERELDPSRARVIRFTREMPTLLAACDAALLNAGGMTCHECFALGTPVILYQPLAGHGLSAARALEADGLVVYPRTRAALLAAVATMRDPEAPLQRSAAHARELSRQQLLSEAVLGAQLQPIPPGAALTTRLGRGASRHAAPIIAAITALGLAAALWAQRGAIAAFEWQVSGSTLALAVALIALGPMVQAIAFWVLLRLVGVHGARLPDAMAVWSWSSLARYSPGGVMLVVVRVREGARLAATRTQVIAASIYEQALAVAGGAVVSALAFVVAVGNPPDLVTAAAIAAVLGVVLARPALLGSRALALARRAGAQLEEIPRGRGMSLVIALTAAGWLAVGAGAAVVVAGLTGGDRPDTSWMVAVYTFAWLVGFCAPFAPGGIGVREAVVTSFLAPRYGVGVAASVAVGLRLVHTAADLLAAAVIEALYRMLWRDAETPLARLATMVRGRGRGEGGT